MSVGETPTRQLIVRTVAKETVSFVGGRNQWWVRSSSL